MAKPPYSSGTERPKPPNSASPSMTSSGMSALARCTCSACGRTLLLGEAVERLADQLEVLAQVPGALGRRPVRPAPPGSRCVAEEGGRRCGPPGLDAPERLAPATLPARSATTSATKAAAMRDLDLPVRAVLEGGPCRGDRGRRVRHVVGDHLVGVDPPAVADRGAAWSTRRWATSTASAAPASRGAVGVVTGCDPTGSLRGALFARWRPCAR